MQTISSKRILTNLPKLALATFVLLAQPGGIAVAEDLLGLYFGGAAGQSQLRGDLKSFSCDNFFGGVPSPCPAGSPNGIPPVSFTRHATGWEAFAGIRPLPFLGAEAEYIDFGSSGTTSVVVYPTPLTLALVGTGTTHPTATALFAVGYLPVPVPYLDIFVKAGLAELRSDINFSGSVGCVPSPPGGGICDPFGPAQSSDRGNTTRPAYGAGIQMKLGSFAVRAAYERINVNTGDPALLSLGLIWRVQ